MKNAEGVWTWTDSWPYLIHDNYVIGRSPEQFSIVAGNVLYFLNRILMSVHIVSSGFKLKGILNGPGGVYIYNSFFK